MFPRKSILHFANACIFLEGPTYCRFTGRRTKEKMPRRVWYGCIGEGGQYSTATVLCSTYTCIATVLYSTYTCVYVRKHKDTLLLRTVAVVAYLRVIRILRCSYNVILLLPAAVHISLALAAWISDRKGDHKKTKRIQDSIGYGFVGAWQPYPCTRRTDDRQQ